MKFYITKLLSILLFFTLSISSSDFTNMKCPDGQYLSGFDENDSLICKKCIEDIVQDIDGNVYKTMTIGTQIWTIENFKCTKYRNGDALLSIMSSSQWEDLDTGAYCTFNNINNNKEKYGLLYNWFAIDDIRNIAPVGWHVPTDSEWITLQNYLIANGYNYDQTTTGNKIAKSICINKDWNYTSSENTPGNNLNTNNKSNFSILPGGYRYINGYFYSESYSTSLWTSTNISSNCAKSRNLYSYYVGIEEYIDYKKCGLYIRLVKD